MLQTLSTSQVSQPTHERRRMTHRLKGVLPEVVVTLLLVLVFGTSAIWSPFFLDAEFLSKSLVLYLEMGVLALALTPVIISGNIDLSVASSMVMVSGVSAYLHANLGLPMVVSLLFGLILGAGVGALNGVMIAYVGLPWVTVTLGTMVLYRGIAQILLGVFSIQQFPDWFTGIDKVVLPGLPVSLPFVVFFLLALGMGLLLHKTVIGRWIYAIGTNEQAALFAGIPVKRVKLLVFMLSGVMSALAGLMMVSRLAVARYDLAQGFELHAITAVVLGGTSIYGGRGSIYGTVMAVFLFGILRTGMGVANVAGETQLTVLGTLLVVAVLASNALGRLSR
ncbi:MAG: ABC transporter permease [bacterium]|nr:ABC transporter permease [bacterium]